ncbi:MAG: general secretion pathway protein GspK [Candidatus Omnitrophica bacterium]|nr:general secretion pathway protein GspK [Candidatus Omnitrophota bacterium]
MRLWGRARNRLQRALPFDEHASVLIAVLWCLFFLSVLAVAIYAYVAPQVGLAQRVKERAQTYYLAEAGVKTAVFMLGDDQSPDYDALNETWAGDEETFRDIRLGDQGYVSIKYEYAPSDDSGASETRYGLVDEERKINVNKATVEILQRLFETVAQTTAQEADDIADSILDWIDEDDEPRPNGAESGYYKNLAGGYPCPNGKFETLEELLLVKGMTPEIFAKVKEHVTVYGAGQVNINTSGKDVLEALGMSGALAEKVIQFRRGNDSLEGTKDDNIFESAATVAATLTAAAALSAEEAIELNSVLAAQLICVRSDYFHGESSGELRYDEEAGSLALTKVVFILDRDKHIRYWHEE